MANLVSLLTAKLEGITAANESAQVTQTAQREAVSKLTETLARQKEEYQVCAHVRVCSAGLTPISADCALSGQHSVKWVGVLIAVSHDVLGCDLCTFLPAGGGSPRSHAAGAENRAR